MRACDKLPLLRHDQGLTFPESEQKRRTGMPLQNHLVELQRKHQALEREIEDAIAHPATDDLRVAQLKRRKLQLKDEILRLRQSERAVN
jgi:hypothetical protein